MLKPLPLHNNILFIDNSFLDELACPRKLQYSQLDHLISAGDQWSLIFGSVTHEVLEYRHTNFGADNLPTYQAAIATEFFNTHPVPEGEHRHVNFLLDLIKRYDSHYSLEMFEVAQHKEPIPCPKCHGAASNGTICIWCHGTGKRTAMTELSFALPLCAINNKTLEVDLMWTLDEPLPVDWIGVVYCGRIDTVLRQSNNRITVMDHKTDSTLGPLFFDRYRMSSQMLGYCWALEQGTGITPWGFVVNGIRTRQPTKKMLDGTATAGETNKWWGESFFRGEENIQPWHLVEWKENTIERIRYLLWRHNTGYMPKESKECARYGKCPFYDVCYLPPDQRQDLLDSTQFRVNDWSPLVKPKTHAKP